MRNSLGGGVKRTTASKNKYKNDTSDVFFYMARGDDYIRQAASEMRTIRSLTRKSEGIHAGKRCMTMTVAGWSKAVKSAAL